MGAPLHQDRRHATLVHLFGSDVKAAHQTFLAASRGGPNEPENQFLLAVAYRMAHRDAGPGPNPADYTDDADGDRVYAQDAERFLDAVDAVAADYLDLSRRVLAAAAELTAAD